MSAGILVDFTVELRKLLNHKGSNGYPSVTPQCRRGLYE
jgi:hypothetical protein